MRRFDSRGLKTAIVVFLIVAASTAGGQEGVSPTQGENIETRSACDRRPSEEPWLRIDARGHTGGIRALAFTPDSARLCSAGLDKNVEVWNLAALRDLRRVFLRKRTIRWQVARGPRGSIYALAAAPNDGLLAIGGYGAMGSLGRSSWSTRSRTPSPRCSKGTGRPSAPWRSPRMAASLLRWTRRGKRGSGGEGRGRRGCSTRTTAEPTAPSGRR